MFSSVLACAIKSAHVFQELSSVFTSRTLSLSFLTNNSSSDSKAFLRFIAFSGSPQQYTVRSFSSMRRHGHSHKLTSSRADHGITLWAYLSQMHRPIALRCMHYGITLWAYLSEPLVKDSHKRLTGLSSTAKNHNTVASFPGSPLAPTKNINGGREPGTDSHVISR